MGDGERSSFGALLKRYRLARGLTQEALAESARLSVRAISDLERGVKSAPRRETIRLLSEALALSPRERVAFEAAAYGSPSNPLATPPAQRTTPAPVGDALPPLAGRDAEIALLDGHMAGHGPPLLLLAGEPGVGKSRLLLEAASRAPAAGLRVLRGGCARRGGEEPYAPLVEAIERLVHSQDPIPLRAMLRGCAWLVRLLPELAEGPIEPLPAWELSPEQERRQMFRAVGRFLANAAGPAGILLLLDDLQWAGADALDLLAILVHSASETCLRVIGAYRDVEVQPADPLAVLLTDLVRAGLAAHQPVAPLRGEAAARLLDDVLAGASDRGQRERVLQLAEGVPFFLLSCAEALRRGDLAAGVPWDVAQGIRQRAAALPDEVRAVLAPAAVIGRVVPCPLLAAVTGQSEAVVLRACEMARGAHLLEEAEGDAYRFAHDLIREVFEGDVGAPMRRALHRRVAEVLERAGTTGAARGPLPVEQLAYHYLRGGEHARALTFLVQSAAHARQATARREEVELLGQAIGLAEQAGQEELVAGLRAQRGRALFVLGQWDDARANLEGALAGLPPEHGEQRAQVLVDLAHLCHWMIDVPSQRRYGHAAETLAEHLGRADLVAGALGALALADSSDGDLRAGLERHRRAFARVGHMHSPALAPAIELNALILYWLGDFGEAIDSARKALALARAANDVTYTARALGNLGMALGSSGRYGEALETFAEAREFARASESGQWLARATAMAGGLHLELFDFGGAETLADEAREIARAMNWPHALISGGIDLLLNLARRREVGAPVERLLPDVEQAAALGQGAHGWLWRLRLAQARAEIALARGDWTNALRWGDDALAQADLRGRVKYQVLGLEARGRTFAAMGRPSEALRDLQDAVRRARTIGDPALLVRAVAALLAVGGDGDLLVDARAAVRGILNGLPDETLRRRFAEAEQVRSILRHG